MTEATVIPLHQSTIAGQTETAPNCTHLYWLRGFLGDSHFGSSPFRARQSESHTARKMSLDENMFILGQIWGQRITFSIWSSLTTSTPNSMK